MTLDSSPVKFTPALPGQSMPEVRTTGSGLPVFPAGATGPVGLAMTRWRVSVDKNVCMGSAMCAAIAPDRFVLDERNRSGPVEAEIDADEVVRDAAASCPAEAISLIDAVSGQPVDPYQ